MSEALRPSPLDEKVDLTFTLPPKRMRFCTHEWQNDAYYFASAIQEVYRLIGLCRLTEETRFVDIGCGQGRMAIGLQAVFPKLKSYTGFDVHAASVAWCNQHLARANFQFRHVDTSNERYNPGGRAAVGLPSEDGSADVVFLYSVFTHMRLDDIRKHLKEIRRVLSPGGRCFLTLYSEDWQAPEEADPPGYLSELGPTSGALHRVVVDKTAFGRACRDAALSIEQLFYRSEVATKQSTYLLVAI